MFYKKATKFDEILIVDLTLTKGQILSKGLYCILQFSQKQTNTFIVVVKTNLFIRFLGEFEDTKSPFKII